MLKEVSAKELEKSCRKCIRISVTDTAALACVLDEFGAQYQVLSEKEADIYAQVNASVLHLTARLQAKTENNNLPGFFPRLSSLQKQSGSGCAYTK